MRPYPPTSPRPLPQPHPGPRGVTRWAALVGIGAGLVVSACGADASHTVLVPPSTTVTLERITEDDPAWNCLTMGNRRCGPDWLAFPAPIADRHDIYHSRCMVNLRDPIGQVQVNCADGYVSGRDEFRPASSQVEAEIGHHDCMVRIGDTSVIYCADGWKESS